MTFMDGQVILLKLHFSAKSRAMSSLRIPLSLDVPSKHLFVLLYSPDSVAYLYCSSECPFSHLAQKAFVHSRQVGVFRPEIDIFQSLEASFF